MKTPRLNLLLASMVVLLLPGCFGAGTTFDNNWRERDPVGYARQHEQDRMWLANDAKKRGYRLPPSEYGSPTSKAK